MTDNSAATTTETTLTESSKAEVVPNKMASGCDKTVLYFIGVLATVAAVVTLYLLSVLLAINSQHQELEEASNADIEAINNLSELIISNQRIILTNQEIDENISKTIDEHLKTMSYSPENNKLLKEVLNILQNNNKTQN